MHIKPIGANQTEVTLANGSIVLFSYETPVACYSNDDGKYYKTNMKWSKTTSKHINAWLEGVIAASVSQSELNDIIKTNQ